ncbi:hypothetical protein ACFL6S_16940 [Candidatus Poribacteria bacterium]
MSNKGGGNSGVGVGQFIDKIKRLMRKLRVKDPELDEILQRMRNHPSAMTPNNLKSIYHQLQNEYLRRHGNLEGIDIEPLFEVPEQEDLGKPQIVLAHGFDGENIYEDVEFGFTLKPNSTSS